MRDKLLPVEEILVPLQAAVLRGDPVVLKAPPGAGKTTRVPLALLESDVLPAGQVWVIQPRRLAARSVAEFLAHSRGEPIGKTIGYHVRSDRKESASTRVLLMTTGMFLRRMQSDPLLEQTSCVILDEFHERSLELDLSLALTQRLWTQLRPDLRMIVMSATLDPGPICDYLGPRAQSLSCEGRSHAVEIFYHETSTRDAMEPSLAAVITETSHQTSGHVLVFLPGIAEIHRVRSALLDRNVDRECAIVMLHGSLSPKEQDAAIHQDSTAQQKIILSTNIAETSVTIEGVTAVIDTGLAKIPQIDSRLGLTRLQTLPISLASADQRAGRAGRTAPGICHRMWSAASHRVRDTFDQPEILRGDLSSAVLTLASLGETDVGEFPWLTPPPEHSVDAATQLLIGLGAMDSSRRVTPLGHRVMSLPLHPRLARFAIEVSGHLGPGVASVAATLLSERDPLEQSHQHASELSLVAQTRWVSRHRGALKRSSQTVVRQLQRALEQKAADADQGRSHPEHLADGEAIARSLLAAYPDRVVTRRAGDPDRGVMVGRRGVKGLSKIAGLDLSCRLLLCHDTDGSSPESRVRAAVEIDEAWLSPGLIQSSVEIDFDPSREAISCRDVRSYMDLVLSATPVSCENSEAAAVRFYEAAIQQRVRVLPHSAPGRLNEFDACLQRIDLVRKHCYAENESPWGDVDSLFRDVCRELCYGRRSFAELRRAPWKDHLIGRIGYDLWQKVQWEAPTFLTLPSGNRASVLYLGDSPPRVEAKIQECFGWKSTPRILAGKVPIQMHLLGPNGRPQQITEDLESFWNHTYAEIRKELRRRYPKHHWPEDPKSARATSNGLKPRA